MSEFVLFNNIIIL